jgi:hypothetical protein
MKKATSFDNETIYPRTEWFSINIDPVHRGLYEVEDPLGLAWSIWDHNWYFASYSPVLAEEFYKMNLKAEDIYQWRGLTKSQ